MKIFIDFDGTLATDSGYIVPENIDFINKYKDKFVLATGRSVNEVKTIFKRSKFKIDAIGGNGSFILFNNSNVKVLNVISTTIVKQILYLLEKYKLPILIHTIDEVYVFDNHYNSKDKLEKIANLYANRILNKQYANCELIDLYIKTFEKKKLNLQDILKLTNITSLEVFYGEAELKREIYKIFKKFGNATESYFTSIEFNGGANKGKGIKEYCKLADETCAVSIGNGINDESMFNSTNIALKMKGSDERLSAIEIPFTPHDNYLCEVFNL